MLERKYGTVYKWLIVIGCGVIVSILPRPDGVTQESWTLLAIFIATIVGSIVQPLTGSAIIFLGVYPQPVLDALKR